MSGFSKDKHSQNTPHELRSKVESKGGSNGAIPSNRGDPMNDKDYALFKQNKHRTIFLRDLPFHFRDNHLRELVLPLVENNNNMVELCRVKYSMKHGKTLQVGIVMFQDDEHAKQVLEKLHASPRCCGRDVRVSFFEPNTENEQSQNGELNFKFQCNVSEPLITEETIRHDLECSYGTLSSVCIRGHFYPSGGGQNGFGFVTFSNCEDNFHDMLASRDESWISPTGIKYEFNRIKPTKACFSPSTVQQGASAGNNGRFLHHSTNHSNQRADNILPGHNFQSNHHRSYNYKDHDPDAPNRSRNAPYRHNDLKSGSSSTFNDVRASDSPNDGYSPNKYTLHDGANYHVVAVEIPANQMYHPYNLVSSVPETSYFHRQVPYHAPGHHLVHDNNINLHPHWQQGQQPAPHVMISMNAPNHQSSVIPPSLPNLDNRLRPSNLPPAISTAAPQGMTYDPSGTSPMAPGISSFSGSLSPSPTAMSSASSGSLQSYPSPYGLSTPHLVPHNGTAMPLGVPQPIVWQSTSISSPMHQFHPQQPPQQRQQHVYPYMAHPHTHNSANTVMYASGSSNSSPRLATMNMYSQLSRSHSSGGSHTQSNAKNLHNHSQRENNAYDATASSNAS